MSAELVDLFLRYVASGAILSLLLVMMVVIAIGIWRLLK
jgi:hypothetical protein